MTDLIAYIVKQLGRNVRQEEVATVLDLSRASITRRIREGFTIEEVLTVLDHYGLSRTAGLIDLGILDQQDVLDALGSGGRLVDMSTDYELARELAMRANPELAAVELHVEEQRRELPGVPQIRDALVVRLERKNAETKPWEDAPTYDPNEEVDFTTYDAASHGEKQQIEDPRGDYS
ncbi:hypothetical protein C8K36_102493 [Rhodococcus sp. OK519]|uniref:hypothetical protein n=1 Tax=Rhodococcus sp. OK519 TaxID=2135729 RepID=UPI000D3D5D78|nr:hypothetical protein C8K36_102493 [Rhodococcus sp. OK519]